MAEAPGLDLDNDRSFQKRYWRFQRVAWIVMVLIILAALAGLTGKGGPLARAEVSGPQASINYPRVARWQATEEIQLKLDPAMTGEAEVEIDGAFGRLFQVEDLQPAPSQSFATADGQRLIFDLGDMPGEKTINIHVRPLQPQLASSIGVRVNDGPPLVMTPVVLP